MIAGMNTGIGFAIPSNMAREVADQLIHHGKYTRSWLGVSITSLKEDPEYRTLVTGVKEGVVVREIMPDGPAAKSDLKPSDVITAVDGNAVTTSQQLRNEIRSKKLGEDVKLDVYRRDKMVQIKVRPEAWPEAVETTPVNRRASTPPDTDKILGVGVQALTPEAAQKFGVKAKSGVLVSEVAGDGLAAEKGIKPGDVITEIDHQPVKSLKEYREALKNVDVKKGVVVNLVSQETSRFVVLKSGE
jgi:serine protease Do